LDNTGTSGRPAAISVYFSMQTGVPDIKQQPPQV